MVRPRVARGETPHPLLDEELGRARSWSVRQELIKGGVDPKRIRVESILRVTGRKLGDVEVSVQRPSEVQGGDESCVDGITILSSLGSIAGGVVHLEVCRNQVCAGFRVDRAALGSGGTMLASLPSPLAGGIRLDQKPTGDLLVIRVNGQRSALKNGDVYRVAIRSPDGHPIASGASSPVGYGSWLPNAKGAGSDACLDAQISIALSAPLR